MGRYDGVEWAQWLVQLFPSYFTDGHRLVEFADYHEELWRWVTGILPDERPDPFVSIWSRFFGKSTNAEATAVYLGCERIRRYGLYVCGTQSQADDHVQNVAGMLESRAVAERYPGMAERLVGKYGQSKGWRIKRVRTATGFTLDAIGLDKAIRGAKIEEQRPDFIILDDLDDQEDTARTVEKKEQALKRKILPAGADNLAILAVQNLIHNNSIFTHLADGRADYLHKRIVSGPHPAIEGLTWQEIKGTNRVRLTGGRPTWQGVSLEKCQEHVDDIGFRAFRVECQHETELAQGVFLGDVWSDATHLVPDFEIPKGWSIDRGYDWGKSKPWCCVWFAEADGESKVPEHGNRVYPKGTLFSLRELYGWTGAPNVGDELDSREQGRRILRAQTAFPWGKRTKPGPADPSIYTEVDNESIADRMKPCVWTPADTGPGTRIIAADAMVTRLKAATVTPMESPGLFVVKGKCPNIVRTFKELQKDPLKDGDVDTDGEDHLFDVVKMRCMAKRREATMMSVGGL